MPKTLFTLLFILISGCQTPGGSPLLLGSQSIAPVATVATAPATPAIRQETVIERRCGLNFDGTVSVNPASRRDAAARFATVLPAVVSDLGCTVISVTVFTDGGWFTHILQYQVPREFRSPCNEGSSTPSRRVLQPFLGFQELTSERCAGQIAAEDRKNKHARDEALAPIRAALEKVDAVSSSCTDLFTHIALLDRISHVNDIDWIASDLAQTCITATKPFNPRHQVVFVVLPGAGYEGRVENRGIAKAADFVTEFTTSTYLLPAEMMAEAWWKKGVQN